METIVVYSPHTSRTARSRLTYVLDWVLCERLGLNYRLTDNEAEAGAARCCIAYDHEVPGSISVPAIKHSDGVAWINCKPLPYTPATGSWYDLPVLFADKGADCTLPFDIFSAVFFLISRYEEYFPLTADVHGRYQATESILFQKGLLGRPIVDEWVEALRQLMEQQWGMTIPKPTFRFLPTYDIDMAYSHVYKGVRRIVGAYVRAMLKGDVGQINERTQVLKKKKTDPYDSFAWLHRLHEQYGYRPVYFVLCALRTTAFDKNIHPRHPAMIRVIKHLSKDGAIGIHPSYYSADEGVAAKEKKVLEEIVQHSVALSRQHYIKLTVPDTFRMLMDNGITEDYSMGYGTHLGFRAGTGSPYLWYDLQKEEVADLRVHPFCFMDTTCHYDNALNTEQSFAVLKDMANALERTGSTLVTIFHNFSLGTDAEWTGWNTAYAEFAGAYAR